MKICIVQTRPGIGDLCIFLPYIHFISNFKNSKITLITKKRTKAKEILKYDPFIEKVIYIDEKKKLGKIDILKILKKNNFDEIYIMQFGFKFFFLSILANIKKIYSYGFFKNKVSISEYINEKIRQWLSLSKIEYNCKIYLNNNSYDNSKNIIIGIGASGLNKKWPITNYVYLVKKLNLIYENSKFIIAGGIEEKKDANYISENCLDINLESLCDLSIGETLQKISRSQFYIGNDTGFMHLCASLNTLSFGLFGDTPTNYVDYNKIIFPIIPKGKKFITHNDKAMHLITVDHVIDEINKNFKH